MKYKYRILLIPVLLFILLFGLNLNLQAPTPQDYPFYDNNVNYQYSGDNNGHYSRLYEMLIDISQFNRTPNEYQFTFEIYYKDMFNNYTHPFPHGYRTIVHNKLFFNNTNNQFDIILSHKVDEVYAPECPTSKARRTVFNLNPTSNLYPFYIANEYYTSWRCDNQPTFNRTITVTIIFLYHFALTGDYFHVKWYINNTLIYDYGNIEINANHEPFLYYQLYIAKTPINSFFGDKEYASRIEHYYYRVYTKVLTTLEIQHNFYNPFNNYIKDNLLLDYTIGYFDREIHIWKNKMNSYNQHYFETGKPWLFVINFIPKSMLMEELTTTITEISTTTFSFITTITYTQDWTNYYCASLLFIPFAFGLLMYFVERRLILIGVGLGFILLHIFLGVSYAYFLLGILIMFLNVILLRYRYIEKE